MVTEEHQTEHQTFLSTGAICDSAGHTCMKLALPVTDKPYVTKHPVKIKATASQKCPNVLPCLE